MDFKTEIEKQLKKEVGEVNLEIPPDFSLGDFALPCFSLAKILKKNPNDIARELKETFKSKYIERIEVKGPYLNFFVNKSILAEDTVNSILKLKERYGSSGIGKGQKMLIEHTSINPNASPHMGRARNALIGDAVARMHKFQGYKTEVHYYINDIGKQIAMLVLGSKGKKVNFDGLLDIYVKFNKELEKKPHLEKEVLGLLAKLETGDKKTKAEFKKIVDICIKGQIEILGRLGIKYDIFDYESKYLFNKDTEEILKKLEKTKLLFIDEVGRNVLDLDGYGLPMKTPVFVLTRGDGTSLYGLRDLAYNAEKLKKCKNSLIILGEDQKLYFQQIKLALELMKLDAPKVLHYSFILLQEGKMSTREGNVVLLGDFIKEAKKKSLNELKKRGRADEKTAEMIGYGAVKYSILKVSPDKNVLFNWDQALDFEGDTGPYIQYSYARACSILAKEKRKGKVDASVLIDAKEKQLISKLSSFPEVVLDATRQFRPQSIANYLGDLAKCFNEFYQVCPVIKAEPKIKNARLALVECTKYVLKNGLSLLGIDSPSKM
ncbi:MAG: arginine--tRNA ligase [Candidatus Nanoarchaeia archaeon]|nr:arginine--tRNA ligase [Candidatus Nanoarchaeia archaeon]